MGGMPRIDVGSSVRNRSRVDKESGWGKAVAM